MKCLRCMHTVHPQAASRCRYLLEYTYFKARREMYVDLRRANEIGQGAVVTHVFCEEPEQEGFADRLRDALGVPPNVDHPVLRIFTAC